MSNTNSKAPPIPSSYTKRSKVSFWGSEYNVKPAAARGHLGDGRTLLWFEPTDTRPDYYLVRVDSSWGEGEDWDGHEHIDEVIDLLIDEFSEREREREYLEEDLVEQGIEPTGDNTDLAGNEDRLGWPVLCLDCGYSWGTMAKFDGKKWEE
jgi:hypothetical protein